MPIASLAKMMTAYIVLKDHPLTGSSAGPSITITPADAATYVADAAASDSVLQVRTGETLTEQQALEALLVASADNVAEILAQWDAGSVSAFVAKMNSTAKAMGMAHTKYTDPSGLDTTTVSTASDQLIIARKAMAIPAFASIVAMPDVTFLIAGTVENFDYDVGHTGIIGIKTGSDTAALGCWAFAARRTIAGKTQTVYGVVLGIPGTAAGTVVGYVKAPWRKTISGLFINGTKLTFRVDLRQPTGTTVAKGRRLGSVSTNDVTGAISSPLVAGAAGSGPPMTWRLTRF